MLKTASRRPRKLTKRPRQINIGAGRSFFSTEQINAYQTGPTEQEPQRTCATSVGRKKIRAIDSLPTAARRRARRGIFGREGPKKVLSAGGRYVLSASIQYLRGDASRATMAHNSRATPGRGGAGGLYRIGPRPIRLICAEQHSYAAHGLLAECCGSLRSITAAIASAALAVHYFGFMREVADSFCF